MNDILIYAGLAIFIAGLFLFVSTAAGVFGLAAVLFLLGVALSYVKAKGGANVRETVSDEKRSDNKG